MARIGLIQTRGIGDIIIALPIAAEFARRGDTVFWPVDSDYIDYLKSAAPYANFIPVRRGPVAGEEYFLTDPEQALRAARCDRTFVLYRYLSGGHVKVQNEAFVDFFKFDEYKYAVTGIPFREKWNLQITRDRRREERLFESLGIERPFICMHLRGSNRAVEFAVPASWERDYQIIRIDERTSSPFDWLATLERAAKLVCIDSCFSNLVEQLNLPNEKHFILRSSGPYTPVLRNDWQFHVAQAERQE